MAIKLGMNGRLYRLTTGTRASWGTADSDGIHVAAAPANLDEVGNVRDVTLNLSQDVADVTTRGNNGWKASAATLKDGSIEFEMLWDPANDDFAKVFAAWLNNTTIAVAVLDGTKTTDGVQGLWADFAVIDFSKEEPLTDAQKVKVKLQPGASNVAPEWVEVSTGSPSP